MPDRTPSPAARRQRRRRRLVLASFWSLFLLLVVALGAAAGIFAGFLRDLPSLDGLEEYQPSIVTTLYTDQDEPFASFYEQRRILVPLAKIPARLKQAVLAVEDSRFYEHRGLSPRAIARALVANVLHRRKAQGGSTITQQLARVLFLTPEKSLTRKIKEALLAVEIEKQYSKDKILEMYFNQVYFGHGAYGVEAAAQTYFKKPVAELTLAEAALIAGLPSAPSRFSPIVSPERARRRREHVLNRMLDQQHITPAEAQAAAQAPFDTARFTRAGAVAPYFVEHVRQALEDTYGAYALYNSGLKIYTTLNLKAQRAAEEALVAGLRELDKSHGYRPLPAGTPASRLGPYPPRVGEILVATVVRVRPRGLEVQVDRYRGEVSLEALEWTKASDLARTFPEGAPVLVQVASVDERRRQLGLTLEQTPEIEGALAALDPKSGALRAMIGGYDFGRSKFNRATQAKRQPGSAFKPFVYAAALDRGIPPTAILDDSPISFHFRSGGKVVEWAPENYDRKFRGAVTMRRALENSINVPTVRLLQQVGVDPVIRMAHQMGIQSELRRETVLALGVSEVTLLELVSAYGVLAHGGQRAEPFAIRKVTDSQGRTLEEHLVEPQQAVRPETAYVLTHLMKGVVERGTGTRAKALQRPVAGKTGTSSEATDVWFVGFTPNLVAGVWVGYDVKRSLGSAETGGRLALPLWVSFMQKALADTPVEDFPVPENVVALRVQHETGRLAEAAARGALLEYFIKGTEPILPTVATPVPVPALLEDPPDPAALLPRPPAPAGPASERPPIAPTPEVRFTPPVTAEPRPRPPLRAVPAPRPSVPSATLPPAVPMGPKPGDR
jgi:penicillin-binding protein 1A